MEKFLDYIGYLLIWFFLAFGGIILAFGFCVMVFITLPICVIEWVYKWLENKKYKNNDN